MTTEVRILDKEVDGWHEAADHSTRVVKTFDVHNRCQNDVTAVCDLELRQLLDDHSHQSAKVRRVRAASIACSRSFAFRAVREMQ
jgi:hypothetical protein